VVLLEQVAHVARWPWLAVRENGSDDVTSRVHVPFDDFDRSGFGGAGGAGLFERSEFFP
jgi:hypothetical protein